MSGDSIISDRYVLKDRLGSGGMSSVYQATDRVLERTVAVKVLAEHLSDDDKFVARFRREALAVAKLVHPNIVQVYDTGVDSGRHYIVMEYVEGRSGAQILQSKGPQGSKIAVDIATQACAGLDYAHRHGIIHRDIKPGNLMIIGGPAVRDGAEGMTVKITDFGIARAAEQTRLTQAGSVVGTAAYLSPEQARGEEANPGSDVYALGVVTYQLLTGRLPYEGSSLAELAIRRENESPLPPTSYDQDVPRGLSTAVLGALEGSEDERYADAETLAEALRAGLTGRPLPLAGIGGAGRDDGDPDDDATSVMSAPATSVTRHMPYVDEPTPARPLPLPPSPPPARTHQPMIRQGDRSARRSRGRSFGRGLMGVLAIALLAALIAGGVLLLTDPSNADDLRRIVRDSISDQLRALEDAIRNHTD